MKKTFFIYSFLILLFIPFVFITDFFPFMRLGMFAEPVRSSLQTELFTVFVSKNNTTNFKQLNSEKMGIPHSSLEYLGRNYFYKKQSEVFLDKLHQNYSVQKSTFRFYQIIIPLNQTIGDTTLIVEKKYE